MGVLFAPAVILSNASFPELSRVSGSMTDLRHILRPNLRLLLGLGALAAAGTFLFADVAVGLIYGRHFDPAVAVLQVFAPVFPLFFMDMLFGNVITAAGKTKEIAVVKVLSIAVSTGSEYPTHSRMPSPLGQRWGRLSIGVRLHRGSDARRFPLAATAWGGGSRRAARLLARCRRGGRHGGVFLALPSMTAWVAVPACVVLFMAFAVVTGLVLRTDLEKVAAAVGSKLKRLAGTNVLNCFFEPALGSVNNSLHIPVEAADAFVLPKVGSAKILLTATNKWPSAARLMIEFSRVGCVVSIVCPVYGHPSQKVRVVHNTFPYKPLAPLDSLADAIEAAKPDIIIPCDDLAVRHLHQLHSSKRARYASEVDIPALIVRSLGPPESYATVASRYLLLKISREEGIRTPETSVIDNLGDLKQWHSAQPFPWVLKADGTTGGGGVRIAHTLEEARGYFSDLRRSIGLMRLIKRLTVDRDLILERQWWMMFGVSDLP